MEETTQNGFRWRWLWVAALIAATIWLLWRLRGVMLPFYLAAGIAFLLNPLVDKLERRGWKRGYGVALTLLILLLLLAAIGLNLFRPLWGNIQDLSGDYGLLMQKFQSLYGNWLARAQQAFPWALPGGKLPPQMEEKIISYLQAHIGQVPGFLGKLLGSVFGFLLMLLLTVIISCWMLLRWHQLGRRLMGLVPERFKLSATHLSRQINRILNAYLRGLVLLLIIAVIVVTLLLLGLGVKYAFLLGLLAGLGYLIPYFGFPSATLIISLVALVTGESWTTIIVIIACLIALNLSFDYFISPRIIGRKVGLHPITVIFAMLAAGELFGFVGILLAMPLAAATKAVLQEFFPEFFSSPPESSAPKGENSVPAPSPKG
jgi:predicted PurR-regulated permease PerM